MKQPFDLDKALAGHTLISRDSRIVTNFRENEFYTISYPYVAECNGVFSAYTKEGRFDVNSIDHADDLFLYVPDEPDQPDQPKPDNDNVKHPSHYTRGKIEVIDFIQDQQLNFACGSIVKYVCRAGYKDVNKHIEDLEKAKQYIDFEINDLKRKSNDNME